MIRVLLVDDHPVVRTGYARLLEQAGDMAVVAEAGDAEEAYAHCLAGLAPDVVVTDLSMPGMGGLELIRRLHARWPAQRVIAFSMHESELLVRRAREAGAQGFIGKSSAPERLVEAVRAVAAGRPWPPAGLPADADDRLAGQGLAELSEREFALFRLLAQGHAPAECAQALSLSPKTVANYQSAIREKLGVATSAALALLAIRCGVIEAPIEST